jgi:hypothetical protein
MQLAISSHIREHGAWILFLALLGPATAAFSQAHPEKVPLENKEQQRSASIIPAQYRGRWAPTRRACLVKGPSTEAVEISRSGWTSFEEGSQVIAPGTTRRGTTYYQVRSFAAEGQSRSGSLALRLVGSHLAMSETVAGQPIHRNLVRCT